MRCPSQVFVLWPTRGQSAGNIIASPQSTVSSLPCIGSHICSRLCDAFEGMLPWGTSSRDPNGKTAYGGTRSQSAGNIIASPQNTVSSLPCIGSHENVTHPAKVPDGSHICSRLCGTFKEMRPWGTSGRDPNEKTAYGGTRGQLTGRWYTEFVEVIRNRQHKLRDCHGPSTGSGAARAGICR